ncbi:craniofacial development protein 2-like [Artemia franciscana]|uniref:craniofacial development protein 2-like n=1 Tax=Artemia franciscana TaxID=6661 RepID=UPI0032DA3745
MALNSRKSAIVNFRTPYRMRDVREPITLTFGNDIIPQATMVKLLEWEQISPRLAKIRFKGSPASISLLSAYAPTRDALDETKNDFYTELQTVTSAIATRDFLIVAGDFNARMRPKDQITSKVIGNFGLGQHCENGEKASQLCPNESADCFQYSFPA